MALDSTALAAITAVTFMLAVMGAVLYGIIQSSKSAELQQAPRVREKEAPVEQQQAAPAAAAPGRRNAASRMQATLRRRQEEAAAAQQAAPAQHAAAEGSDVSESGSDEDEEGGPQAAQSRKDHKREEKQLQQEARLAAQQARENKSSAYDERQRSKLDKREAARLAQEDEIRKAEEERIKKEDEEAAQWMGMISVETEGTGECDDQEESQGLLAQFIDYIKIRKTVPLEELATEFKLRTTDVIDRVQGLEAMGRLTGVMDERGKYIYISLEEMHAVASYITSQGRVAISELAAKSDTFIDMEAKAAAAAAGIMPSLDFESLVGATQ